MNIVVSSNIDHNTLSDSFRFHYMPLFIFIANIKFLYETQVFLNISVDPSSSLLFKGLHNINHYYFYTDFSFRWFITILLIGITKNPMKPSK